jgi:hypothetical protein
MSAEMSNSGKCLIGIAIERMSAVILDDLSSLSSHLHHVCSLPNQMVISHCTTPAV